MVSLNKRERIKLLDNNMKLSEFKTDYYLSMTVKRKSESELSVIIELHNREHKILEGIQTSFDFIDTHQDIAESQLFTSNPVTWDKYLDSTVRMLFYALMQRIGLEEKVRSDDEIADLFDKNPFTDQTL